MNTLGRVPMCDISTFVHLYSEEKEDNMERHSERNGYAKKVQKKRYLGDDHSSDEDYTPNKKHKNKLRKTSEDDDSEQENSSSNDEESSDEDFTPEKTYKSKENRETPRSKTPKYFNQDNLTEYEKMVQKNREEKIAFIESLKFNEIKESLSVAVKNLQVKRKPLKTVKRPPPRSSEVLPRRKSLRLAKVDIDLSEEAIAARVKSEDNEVKEKKFPAQLPFSKALQGDNLYEDFSKDFSNLDHGNTKPFNDYVSHFQSMQLSESQIAKVVYSRITSMTIHPMREKILVAAGSKYGKIGFWNVNSDSNPYVFETHNEGITLLKFNPERPQMIVSSSYDGTLRCGDLESCVFNEAYNVSEETSCTHFDFLSANTFLVGQKNGNVSVVDYRMRIKAAGKKHPCHDYPVKSVSVHPLDKSYFISAENKGTIRLWDLRKLQAQPIVEVQHHKRCVQSAFFSPLSGKSVLTTSSDDSICLFDSSKLGKSLMLKNSLRHNNQTGRWLTTFRATWLPNTDDAFVVGSMSHPRRIEIYDDKMNNIFNFTHEYLGCITSVNIFHPSLPVLAGSNSSGKVYVFADGGF